MSNTQVEFGTNDEGQAFVSLVINGQASAVITGENLSVALQPTPKAAPLAVSMSGLEIREAAKLQNDPVFQKVVRSGKLSDSAVQSIRARAIGGETYQSLAGVFEMSLACVRNISIGKSYAHVAGALAGPRKRGRASKPTNRQTPRQPRKV